MYKEYKPYDPFTPFDANSLLRQGRIPVANTGERAQIATPTEGMEVYRLDSRTIERYNGTAWIVPIAGGRISAPTNAQGIVQVTHGMGKAPASVTAVIGMDSPVIPEHLKVEVGNFTATTFDVRVRRADQGNGPFAGNQVVFYWTAIA